MKFKMAATAELSLTLDPIYGENVSKRFFSETTWTIETKLPKWFQRRSVLKHFPHFEFHIGTKNLKLIYVLRWQPSWISDRQTW
jgi:hypothetical protein